ncbi:rhamnulokinase family protein [Salinisphaera sp. Q1T1-3]|uniref:rhamnulokinase n=1 Tax=Salinisphaera sp. Q1T1-3 TaxID=2321229 RepID=UPI000E75B761|nr:FGGY-family carbohydrate kinase [Salinisphaera sp. Q1T1-3]RJS91495.1 rhamnulokinase [Salinisphaera sp. Q1T1-3]
MHRTSSGPSRHGAPVRCLAFDFGAGSSRAMLAERVDGRLALREVHRFDTATDSYDGQTCWDMAALYAGLADGLARARESGPVHAVGIDSWGVDFGLIDAGGALVMPPLHYRNGHGTQGLSQGLLSLEAMHRRTGAQRLDINTVCQLLAIAERWPARLAEADTLLMMADLLTAYLSGSHHAEYTLASTSGLIDPVRGDWDRDLVAELGLPTAMLPPMIPSGTICGTLRETLNGGQTSPTAVVAVGSHDTASAVAGLDLGAEEAFLILGSWSLLGVESDTPVYDARTLAHGFGNEGGVCGTHRLITNINGLYLIQMLREAWQTRHGVAPDYAEISAAASDAQLEASLRIDPDDDRFFAPDDMIAAIDDFCAAHGLGRPVGIGDYALAIYRGLADQIAARIRVLETVFERPVNALCVSGGGSQDAVLCAHIRAAAGKPLRPGAIEASAYGNALMQLKALGCIETLAEGRALLPEREPQAAG